MKLIVGLGNPGSEYNFTRHNFGFLALDFYVKTHNLNWEQSPKFNAIYLKQNDLIFLKPQTFYNNSGVSVKAFANFYKIPNHQILIIADDLTLPFGTLRYRQKGTSGGNNGLKSIESHLKTTDFPRLRLGTSNDKQAFYDQSDFVLSRFSDQEKALLPQILHSASQKIDELLKP